MVYFAGFPTWVIKIGQSVDVKKRISALSNQFQRPVSLLKVIPGGLDQEQRIHQRFKHLRLPVMNEQFRPGPDLMEFIQGLGVRPSFKLNLKLGLTPVTPPSA